MSAPSVAATGSTASSTARPGGVAPSSRPSGWTASSTASSASRRSWSTASCTCRSSSWCSSPSTRTSWRRSGPDSRPIGSGSRSRQLRRDQGARQQRDHRVRQRHPGDPVRDDGCARPAARRAQDAGRVRRPDLHQHHRARRSSSPWPRSSSSPRRSTSINPILSAIQGGGKGVFKLSFGHWHGHQRPRPVQHEPGPVARARPPVGHGPHARRGQPGPVRHAVATFRQITFPQLLPAIVAGIPAGLHVQLRRLRHHDVRDRSGLDDPAAVHLRAGQASA